MLTQRWPMAAPAAALATTSGHCKWFNVKKGFGFLIAEDGTEVFVHQTDIHAPGFRSLAEEEPVEFDIGTCERSGKLRASNVTGPNGDYVKGAPKQMQGDRYDDRY